MQKLQICKASAVKCEEVLLVTKKIAGLFTVFFVVVS